MKADRAAEGELSRQPRPFSRLGPGAGRRGAMSKTAALYKRHRFAPALIARAVRLCLRFSLSLRAVEEMLLERGVEVSHETLRRWVAKFGPVIVRGLPRREARHGEVWHLDEARISVRGRRFWLWRAVDEHGVVLEGLLQPRRDRKAAKRLLRRLLKTAGRRPKRIITDKPACLSGGQARRRPPPRTPRPQGPRQSRREQSPAVPIAGEGHARPPLARRAAALRRDALGHPQPLRSLRPPSPLRSRHPPPSPGGLRRVAPSSGPRRLRLAPPATSCPPAVNLTAPICQLLPIAPSTYHAHGAAHRDPAERSARRPCSGPPLPTHGQPGTGAGFGP